MSLYSRVPLSKILFVAGCCIAGFAALSVLFLLAQRIIFEWHGPFNADSALYWTVGRGILNGHIPYRDLFETKPPGMFLLSALSWALTGDERFTAILQVTALLVMPIFTLAAVRRITRSVSHLQCIFLLLIALAFSISLTLYTATRSGEFQTESFGAALIIAYALVLVWQNGPLGTRRMFLAGILIFCAVGLKEPFILTAAAVAFLLARHPRDLIRSFLLPFIGAVAGGFIALWMLGYLEPYFYIYLPEMLGKYITRGESLWIRSLWINRIIDDLRAYSPLLLAGILAILLWCSFLILYARRNFLTAFGKLLTIALAFYLLSLAVAMGGTFWPQHYVFAVPGYVTLFLLFIRIWKELPPGHVATAALVCIFLLGAMTPWMHPTMNYSHLLSLQQQKQATREQAARIDEVLDRCGLDRYLFLGANGMQPFAFTQHSPLGPLFFQYQYLLDENRPAFRKSFTHALVVSSLVIENQVSLSTLTEPVQAYLLKHFSEEPWPCASGIRGNGRFRFLYRHTRGEWTGNESHP